MILVIGATGNVGKQVVSQLANAGKQVRALTRDLTRLNVNSSQVEGVQGDLENKESLLPALRGVKKVFLVVREHGIETFVAAAVQSGVEQIVLLSSVAVLEVANKNHFNTKRHLLLEETVAASTLNWTFVRPGYFATNSLQWASSIRRESVVRLPYLDVQFAPIHEADIAAVSVAALTKEDMAGKAFTLTGPASISQREMVATIGTVLGQPIRLEELSDDQYRENMSGYMSSQLIERMLTYFVKLNGVPAMVNDTVAQLVGRPAKTYADWVADHKSDFA